MPDNDIAHLLSTASGRSLTTQELAHFNDQLEGLEQLLGINYVHIGPSGCTARLQLNRSHTQPFGLTHGGVYQTLVESLGSVAGAIAARAAVVGMSNSTEMIRPSKPGDVLTASTSVVHCGARTHIIHVDIRAQRPGDGKESTRVAFGTLRTTLPARPR